MSWAAGFFGVERQDLVKLSFLIKDLPDEEKDKLRKTLEEQLIFLEEKSIQSTAIPTKSDEDGNIQMTPSNSGDNPKRSL